MSDADTSRMVNVKLSLLPEEKAGLVELLYPTLYKFSCILGKYTKAIKSWFGFLDLRYFPFDIQVTACNFDPCPSGVIQILRNQVGGGGSQMITIDYGGGGQINDYVITMYKIFGTTKH